MTTTTKRPDGGELKQSMNCNECGRMFRDFSPEGEPHCQCDEKAVRAMKDEMMGRTPTNESPAPQATKKTYIKPLRTIVEIDARYADQIRDLLNAPAPQPPVEGLREALKEAIAVFEGMNDDEINEELLPRLKAALFDFTPAHLPTGREHDLKTWPVYFEEVIAGRKTFEVRHNDRDYKVGDILWLREWSVTTGEYSGRETRRLVTYVMSGRCGVEKDTIIMALASPSLTAGAGKEPILWQWRHKALDGPWSDWDVISYSIEVWRETFADQIERGTVEARPLYAAPATLIEQSGKK